MTKHLTVASLVALMALPTLAFAGVSKGELNHYEHRRNTQRARNADRKQDISRRREANTNNLRKQLKSKGGNDKQAIAAYNKRRRNINADNQARKQNIGADRRHTKNQLRKNSRDNNKKALR